MLSKCANPACSAVFRYLHEGKLFVLSKAPPTTSLAVALTDCVLAEHFWLCGPCSRQMRVSRNGDGVTVMQLHGVSGGCTEKEGPMQAATEIEGKERKDKAGFERILVATDFSEASRRALSEALALVSQWGGGLCVVHAIPPEPGIMNWESGAELEVARQRAQRQMKTFLADIGPHHRVERIFIQHGPVAKVLAPVIQSEHIDLLVIGTRGRGGLRKLALGSVAEELLRVATCPVLTVGPKAGVAAKGKAARLDTILVATDFGAGANKALPLAIELAEGARAKLILLHMIPPMPAAGVTVYADSAAAAVAEEVQTWRDTVRDQSLAYLRQCIPSGSRLTQEPELIVEMEFVPEGILTAAETRHAGLIVMGANRTLSARVAAHYPWGLVHEVVCRAACPVLTVAG